ncbi:MAG: AmmeMemoRadiSam system protein B [Candidatus Buchananbacteria bacterium]
MPIVFAAIAPHPPVLIPEIGKENLEKIKQTEAAYKKLEQEFYASKPESLVVISPHGNILPDSFNINLNADYEVNFKEFGEYSLELKFKSDFMVIQEIRAADETNKTVPIILSSDKHLDHGVGIPLYFLSQHSKNIPVIPITTSGLGYKEHFEFGKFLHRMLSRTNKRFGILASGDLSHRLTENAPGGFSPEGKKMDKKIIDLIKAKDFEGLMKIDSKLIEAGGECGLRSFLILAGMVESQNLSPEVLSYEGPFGVGYLVCNFKVN